MPRKQSSCETIMRGLVTAAKVVGLVGTAIIAASGGARAQRGGGSGGDEGDPRGGDTPPSPPGSGMCSRDAKVFNCVTPPCSFSAPTARAIRVIHDPNLPQGPVTPAQAPANSLS